MNCAFALSLLASSVVAQQITAPPGSLFKQASSLNIGAVANGGADACLEISNLLLDCSKQWGGIDNIENLPPDELLGCACCDGRQKVYTDYSSCSVYMTSAMDGFQSEADIYGELATQCSALASCTASGAASVSVSASASRRLSSATQILSGSSEATGTVSSLEGSITPAAIEATECNLMSSMFVSCQSETPRFADLGYRSQAECYCCASSRGQSTGTLTWTDEIDEYASTCWKWADESATNTKWDYAVTFATFCENFSDVCRGVAVTGAAENTATDATTSGETGAVTVTVTGGNAQSTQTETPGGAAGLRAGCAGAIVAVVAGLIML